MLKCNGKTFMNLQEAVQWLLNNNALFFMCNEDYAADTEISLEELVNPSPANPKIGSLVLFADGSIATITGITDDSFIVGSDFINIRLQKTVTHFSIDASQHLIVTYTDGTSEDLGAIFSGNINIDGTLTASEAQIFENITDQNGHLRFLEGNIDIQEISGLTKEYGKWSLSGTHLMIVLVLNCENALSINDNSLIALVDLPDWIKAKIIRVVGDTVQFINNIAYGSDYTTQTFRTRLVRTVPASVIQLRNDGNWILTKARKTRIQFDILIDAE